MEKPHFRSHYITNGVIVQYPFMIIYTLIMPIFRFQVTKGVKIIGRHYSRQFRRTGEPRRSWASRIGSSICADTERTSITGRMAGGKRGFPSESAATGRRSSNPYSGEPTMKPRPGSTARSWNGLTSTPLAVCRGARSSSANLPRNGWKRRCWERSSPPHIRPISAR